MTWYPTAYVIRRALEALRLPPPPDIPSEYDLRARSRVRKTRPVGAIERVILHQTGVEFGVSHRQLRDAGGDKRLAHRLRFTATPYHYVITRHGDLLRVHQLDRWTYHAGKVNRFTVGVAVEGRFPAFERDRGDRHTTLTSQTISAVGRHLRTIAREVEDATDRLIPWSTHRQCSRRRPADPGEELVHLARLANIDMDLDWTFGSGRPAPEEWR